MPREVASLVCTACGVEFLPEEGGICASCRRPFCGFDLYVTDKDTAPRCQDCLGATEGRRLLAKSRALSLWARRQLILAQGRRKR